jgi:E3 ubiquitin-protein ligase NRDP1
MFRTVVGDTGFNSGVIYWEIVADSRTENEMKIGVVTKNGFNMDSSFSDFDFGFAYYGLGQLRHGSNSVGQPFGKKFKK